MPLTQITGEGVGTLVTPALGTPSSGVLTSCTGVNYDNFKNRIINGGMVIDQRSAGASVTQTTIAATYSVDRWNINGSITSKFTAQQNAAAVTPPTGFTNYLGVTSSSSYTLLAGDYFYLMQGIEGFNVSDLGFGSAGAATVTLSFWVRSSLTGNFGGALRNKISGSDRSYSFTYTINAANTWEKKTVTVAGDVTGTWTTNNSCSLTICFSMGTGSTFSGTAGAWAGSNLVSATGAVSVVGTNGATWYVTGVQLEKGSAATSFDYRPYGTELALCQRYYQYWGGETAYGYFAGVVTVVSTTTAYLSLILNVPMRSSPTFTYAGALSSFDLRNASNASHIATALTQDQTTTKILGVTITTSSLTANAPGQLIGNNTTAGQLIASAEL